MYGFFLTIRRHLTKKTAKKRAKIGRGVWGFSQIGTAGAKYLKKRRKYWPKSYELSVFFSNFASNVGLSAGISQL